ncbi:MAG: hypothetical protein IKB05_04790 [Alphaproteobacteria bacterium]|nr:hypothetical protein [Alphaproteobacteria bacterium]
MKKICLLLLFVPVSAFAALECAPLMYVGSKTDGTTQTTCTSGLTDKRLDWISTCNSVYSPSVYEGYDAMFETGNYTVRGVAGCSKSGGTAYTTTTDILTTLTTASDENNNKCWCKMVTPVVSKWVYIRSYEHIGSCAKSCAYRCEEAMANNATFRDTLFSSAYYE